MPSKHRTECIAWNWLPRMRIYRCADWLSCNDVARPSSHFTQAHPFICSAAALSRAGALLADADAEAARAPTAAQALLPVGAAWPLLPLVGYSAAPEPEHLFHVAC